MASTRAEILTLRTYARPLDEAATQFESWPQIVNRVVGHQHRLWVPHGTPNYDELEELRALMLARKISAAGRTLWLGGTDLAFSRAASQFNCAFLEVETVHDAVDAMWLLLNGCGDGFRMKTGTLNGFTRPIPEVEVIRSRRTAKGGRESNVETVEDGVWTIKIGDSGEAWAKAIGKILAGKHVVNKLVFDLSAIRPAGGRLAGYGWISSGDEVLARVLLDIAKLMNARAGQLLRKIDILDLMNYFGVIQTGRRGAELALMDVDDPEADVFIVAKKNHWPENYQRSQSNNSIVFWSKPDRTELNRIFQLMLDAGGSEPGFINGAAARARAPWFSGVNPCAEILLPNKGFCNLFEVDLAKFNGDFTGLQRAVYIAARANYRQTLVNLDDGILQRAWHENNEFLHLCGVGLCGVVRWTDIGPYQLRRLRSLAHYGAYSMADELGKPRPANVTTGKPGGTIPKIMDTTEGATRPSGQFIFNNINFNKHDPLVNLLRDANYHVWDNPSDPDSTLVQFPVQWEASLFTEVDGVMVNMESAVAQLNRYKLLMDNYIDQNCSITIYYDPGEIPSIVDWLLYNWDSYVGVSFLLRTDPTKSAADLGYLYLPQAVVDRASFENYTGHLRPIDLTHLSGQFDPVDDNCLNGFCPVR